MSEFSKSLNKEMIIEMEFEIWLWLLALSLKDSPAECAQVFD